MPVAAIAVPTPLTAGGLGGGAASSPLLPGAEEAVRSHDAHAFVLARPAGEGFEALRDASLAASEVAAALGGTAVYWPAAGALSEAGAFADEVETALSGGRWPVGGWMGFEFLGSARAPGASSRGLAPFLGYEVTIAPAPRESSIEAVGALLMVAIRLLDEGPVLRDGEAVELPSGDLRAQRSEGRRGAPDRMVLMPGP